MIFDSCLYKLRCDHPYYFCPLIALKKQKDLHGFFPSSFSSLECDNFTVFTPFLSGSDCPVFLFIYHSNRVSAERYIFVYPPCDGDKERTVSGIVSEIYYSLHLRSELIVNWSEGIFGQFERIDHRDVDCVKETVA